jgi:predicted dienelactone hydrolase
MPRLRARQRLLALPLLAPLLVPLPAGAIETIKLRLPMLQETFTVKVSELRDPKALLQGTSDLAEVNRATNGAIGRQLNTLLESPLPLQVRNVMRNAMGSALLDQVLLLISALGEVDGIPQQPETSAAQLEQALQKAAAKGSITLADVLAVVPGKTATIDLSRFLMSIQRLQRQQREAAPLVAATAPATADRRLSQPGPAQPQRREQQLPVSHRSTPLPLVVIEPSGRGNGRLVVVSHGLWDGPDSFEGWANHLASHGYTVVLPHHPGSDLTQKQAMLAGKAPPPGPAELELRPRDVSAVIDAAAAGRLNLRSPVTTDNVLVAGHSWGATTALQLAGARPSSVELREFCTDMKDPARNLSWVLQCSFLDSADRSGLADPRVKAVVAVSPPMRLLFASGGRDMNAQVLLVSGTRDWVVPVGPEAIEPTRNQARDGGIAGHRLVLAEGGDHFNLRGPAADGGAPLKGLILAWFDGQAVLPANGWGNATVPLRDVTDAVTGSGSSSR